MFRLSKDYFTLFCHKKGFSLIELLTTLVIAGTLAVLGIKSYQSQSNKTKTAQAKYALSYVYSSEQNFKASWNTYHENLIIVGAIPEGPYSYDIGFKIQATTDMSQTDGDLANYPYGKTVLPVQSCATFSQICTNKKADMNQDVATDCASVKIEGKNRAFFYGDDTATFNCKVTAGQNLSDCSTSDCGNSFGTEKVLGGADENRFIAYAVSWLKNQDVWSIDQEKTFVHKKDGTR